MSTPINPKTGFVKSNTSEPTAPARPGQPTSVGTVSYENAGKIQNIKVGKGKP